MFKAGELSSLDFKSFSILSPLVRLRGRNGGLSLAIGLRASCAIGVKVVSLRSTLSTFWVVLVVLGGFDDLGGSVRLYICNADFGGWLVCLYICNGRLPALLGVWGYFKLSSFISLLLLQSAFS